MFTSAINDGRQHVWIKILSSLGIKSQSSSDPVEPFCTKVRKMAEECTPCCFHTAVVLWRKCCVWVLPPWVVPFTLTLYSNRQRWEEELTFNQIYSKLCVKLFLQDRWINLKFLLMFLSASKAEVVNLLQKFLINDNEMYGMREFYQYIISHLWPILHFKELLCLTKPHSVWVHLMEIISLVHLHTMAWIINIQGYSQPAEGWLKPARGKHLVRSK